MKLENQGGSSCNLEGGGPKRAESKLPRIRLRGSLLTFGLNSDVFEPSIVAEFSCFARPSGIKYLDFGFCF
jgi:hypothetical protein